MLWKHLKSLFSPANRKGSTHLLVKIHNINNSTNVYNVNKTGLQPVPKPVEQAFLGSKTAKEKTGISF